MVTIKIKHDGMGLSSCEKRLFLNTLTYVLSGKEPDVELVAGDGGHVFSYSSWFPGFVKDGKGRETRQSALTGVNIEDRFPLRRVAHRHNHHGQQTRKCLSLGRGLQMLRRLLWLIDMVPVPFTGNIFCVFLVLSNNCNGAKTLSFQLR